MITAPYRTAPPVTLFHAKQQISRYKKSFILTPRSWCSLKRSAVAAVIRNNFTISLFREKSSGFAKSFRRFRQRQVSPGSRWIFSWSICFSSFCGVFYKREPLPELPEPLELLPKLHQVLCKLPINFGILRFFDRGGDETCQNHSRYRDPLKDNLWCHFWCVYFFWRNAWFRFLWYFWCKNLKTANKGVF